MPKYQLWYQINPSSRCPEVVYKDAYKLSDVVIESEAKNSISRHIYEYNQANEKKIPQLAIGDVVSTEDGRGWILTFQQWSEVKFIKGKYKQLKS